MSTNSHPTDYGPDDALPPVQPPSAGFLLQLFIIPGLIVLIVVAVWVMFNWLAQMGNDSQAYVRALRTDNANRWQQAYNLANDLRKESQSNTPRLTIDPQMASDLAGILQSEIDRGKGNLNKDEKDQSLRLRVYLCRALGEFRIPDPLDALIHTAEVSKSEEEGEVRRVAIEAIATLASKNTDSLAVFVANDKLQETLISASSDDDARVRSLAAVAMGVIGGDVFVKRLAYMQDDANADVRYNAALRLAHLGQPEAMKVLVEMLDPEETAGRDAEQNKDLKNFKGALITLNALRATQQLADANSTADLTPLVESLQNLLANKKINNETRDHARPVLVLLEERAKKQPGTPAGLPEAESDAK